MAYQPRDNSGALWVNDRKQKDTHPDRTGTLIVEGVEYFIDGWLKEANGKKFLSLSVKRKNKQPQQQPERQQQTTQRRTSPPPQRAQPPQDPDLDAPSEGEYQF